MLEDLEVDWRLCRGCNGCSTCEGLLYSTEEQQKKGGYVSGVCDNGATLKEFRLLGSLARSRNYMLPGSTRSHSQLPWKRSRRKPWVHRITNTTLLINLQVTITVQRPKFHTCATDFLPLQHCSETKTSTKKLVRFFSASTLLLVGRISCPYLQISSISV